MNVMNEINYNYTRSNNKGIFLLPESLRIDTTPKIESLMIKLKNIDENGNREIIFSKMMAHNSLLCRRKACIHRRKMNTSQGPV